MFTPLHIIFYVLATVALISATAVITLRNPVRSALSLVVTFFAMSGIWMLLRAEFLSLILLLVYVGAVMTLFLFVVMMLNIDKENLQSNWVRFWPFGLLIVFLVTILVLTIMGPTYFGATQMPAPAAEPANYSNTERLGMLLFTEYAYPFEIAGVLLLAAIVAAITLAHRTPKLRKYQNISAQIAVKPSDRLKIIKMPAEPKPAPRGPQI